jgi:cytochrome c oxidase subunit 2
MVLPVNKKVRFLITANDVIHSWWVPALAVKRDAIPGFINETWTKAIKTGVYRGQCAELCGKDHGYMPIVVNVVEEAEYQTWLAGKRSQAAEIKELMSKNFSLDEQMASGKTVYDKNCASCHGAAGEGNSAISIPAIAGSSVATGDLARHLDVGVNGVSGTMMQAFGGIINDVEMAAVITYQRNAFGNNMGDIVQPIDVYNFKQGK